MEKDRTLQAETNYGMYFQVQMTYLCDNKISKPNAHPDASINDGMMAAFIIRVQMITKWQRNMLPVMDHLTRITIYKICKTSMMASKNRHTLNNVD